MSDNHSRYDVVRVKAPGGAEFNATRAYAKNTGATVLEGKPTHNPRTGLPLPGKPDAGLTGNAATKIPAAGEADTKKESR